MADGRTAHVKRVFAAQRAETEGDNPADTHVVDQVDPDLWIDVLRIDGLPVSFASRDDGVVGQVINWVLHWNDDPSNPERNIDDSNADVQHENANAARETHQRTIRNPESPDDLVKLWILDKAYLAWQGDDEGKSGQVVALVFNNTPPSGGEDNDPHEAPVERKATVIRVVNNDLGGLTMADDDGSHPRMVDWEAYLKALKRGTPDASQYLDVEVTDRAWHSFQAEDKTGKEGQIISISLLNQEIEKLFDRGDAKAKDADGRPSLIRTDPLQAIINVGFGGLAVDFGDGASNAPDPPKQATMK